MRFIATADWQLGMTAHYLNDEARPRFNQARFDVLKRIAQLATERNASFILVCGDVFETNQLDRKVVSRTFEALKFCSVPVILLPGNHDPLDAATIYDSVAFKHAPAHIQVLRNSNPVEIVDGVEIIAAPWFSKAPTTDLVAEACQSLEKVPAGNIRIIAGHGGVSTLSPDRESLTTIDIATLSETICSGKANIAILGDRHSTTEVTPEIWYPGAPEVTHRREEDPGNVLVIDIEPNTKQLNIEKVRVGHWVFRTITKRLDGLEDIKQFESELDAIPNKECSALWMALSGTLTISEKARLDAMLKYRSDLFARLDYWQRHTDLAIMPDDQDFADLELSGFTRAALEELITTANSNSNQAEIAQDALGIMYRFSRNNQ